MERNQYLISVLDSRAEVGAGVVLDPRAVEDARQFTSLQDCVVKDRRQSYWLAKASSSFSSSSSSFSVASVLNLWDFSFERRSRKDAVPVPPPAFNIDSVFFAVFRPPRPFRDIWTRVVLSARHPLAQRRNYVGPRDALRPRLKKIEITPVANGSPHDPAASPWDLTPSDNPPIFFHPFAAIHGRDRSH